MVAPAPSTRWLPTTWIAGGRRGQAHAGGLNEKDRGETDDGSADQALPDTAAERW